MLRRIAIAGSMLFGVGIFVFLVWSADTAVVLPIPHSPLPSQLISLSYPDSDGDGFADWEEAFAGTDALDDKDAPHTTSSLTSPQPPLKGGVGTIPKSPLEGSAPSPDRKVGARERDVSEFRTYGNTIASIIASGAPPIAEQQTLFEALVAGQSPEARGAVVAMGGGYARASAAIAALAIPDEAHALNAGLADALAAVGEALARVAEERAGVTSGAGWSAYSVAVTAASRSLFEIASFFKSHGVSFAPNEPGAIFTF